jgi:hypothetical protein
MHTRIFVCILFEKGGNSLLSNELSMSISFLQFIFSMQDLSVSDSASMENLS